MVVFPVEESVKGFAGELLVVVVDVVLVDVLLVVVAVLCMPVEVGEAVAASALFKFKPLTIIKITKTMSTATLR